MLVELGSRGEDSGFRELVEPSSRCGSFRGELRHAEDLLRTDGFCPANRGAQAPEHGKGATCRMETKISRGSGGVRLPPRGKITAAEDVVLADDVVPRLLTRESKVVERKDAPLDHVNASLAQVSQDGTMDPVPSLTDSGGKWVGTTGPSLDARPVPGGTTDPVADDLGRLEGLG